MGNILSIIGQGLYRHAWDVLSQKVWPNVCAAGSTGPTGWISHTGCGTSVGTTCGYRYIRDVSG